MDLTGNQYLNGTPTLLDHRGNPISSKHKNRVSIPDGNAIPGGIALPNGFMFVGRTSGGDNSMWMNRWDEAMKQSREDAIDMLHDCSIRALVQERILAFTNLKWHLEVPDEKDKHQVRVKDGLTRLVKGIILLHRIIPWLGEGCWYGRAGVQADWEWTTVRDEPVKPDEKDLPPGAPAMPGMPQGMPQQQGLQMMRGDHVLRYLRNAVMQNPQDKLARKALDGRMKELGLPQAAHQAKRQAKKRDRQDKHKEIRALTVRQAWPVNGDAIGHQYDGTPFILVDSAHANELNDACIINATLGQAISLRGTWRDRFIISRWFMEQRDFFTLDQADAVFGVGIRSHIFWCRWLRQEALANITDYYSRVGLGVNLWQYSSGNPQALAAVQKAARENTDRANIFIPVVPGEEQIDVLKRLEVPTSGTEQLLKLIEYYDKAIERYIVGQEGSASATSGSGHSNDGSNAFMQQTKGNITKQDASWCAEAMTGSEMEPGFLSMMQRHTYPESDFPVWWKFDVESQESAERLTAIKSLVDMGVSVKADDARAAAGVSKPADGEEIVTPPQQPGAAGAAPPPTNPLAALTGGGAEAGGAPEPGGAEVTGPEGEAGGGASEPEGDFLKAMQHSRQATYAKAIKEAKKKHRYSTTHFRFPESLAAEIKALAKTIADADLAEDGRSDDPHLTARYGLHTNDSEPVATLVEGFGPVKAKLGKISVFPAAEAGDDADVVKIEVMGQDLGRMNKALGGLPNTETHPNYNPHITLGYVKPGMGKKCAGSHPLEGREVSFDTLHFSDLDGKETPLSLLKPDKSLNRLSQALQHLRSRGRADMADALIAAWARRGEAARCTGGTASESDFLDEREFV